MSFENKELKPCPFCGEKPIVSKHYEYNEFRLVHRCRVIGPISIDWTSEENIIKRWNTRFENV